MNELVQVFSASNQCQGAISFAELDASVQGWINHVRYGDTWGLRASLFADHPV